MATENAVLVLFCFFWILKENPLNSSSVTAYIVTTVAANLAKCIRILFQRLYRLQLWVF